MPCEEVTPYPASSSTAHDANIAVTAGIDAEHYTFSARRSQKVIKEQTMIPRTEGGAAAPV